MPKTRLDILTDIEDELCVNLPVDILPSDTNFKDKWYSEKELICFRRNRCDEHKLYLYRDGSVYMCKLGCKYEECEMKIGDD